MADYASPTSFDPDYIACVLFRSLFHPFGLFPVLGLGEFSRSWYDDRP